MAAKLLSLFLVGLLWIAAPAAAGKYRQPAYISNAYFSDKMSEEGDVVRPRSVAKALRARTTGVVGYFILDLVLTTQGTHLFKVNIINNAGEKTTDLIYAPVSAPPGEELPLYTAAGAISGEFAGLHRFTDMFGLLSDECRFGEYYLLRYLFHENLVRIFLQGSDDASVVASRIPVITTAPSPQITYGRPSII